ncbi:MAG TPA: hypothetical protein VLJ39_08365, partial [Tepidisphaeraceae bacterium]|nr:hypothetical protein [Tepidisphaeraceae bacterium]
EEFGRWNQSVASRLSLRPGGPAGTAKQFLSHKSVLYVAWYSRAAATRPLITTTAATQESTVESRP